MDDKGTIDYLKQELEMSQRRVEMLRETRDRRERYINDLEEALINARVRLERLEMFHETVTLAVDGNRVEKER
jgi:hypothetical protein